MATRGGTRVAEWKNGCGRNHGVLCKGPLARLQQVCKIQAARKHSPSTSIKTLSNDLQQSCMNILVQSQSQNIPNI